MNVFTLKAEQWIPRPLEDVFPFFSDPRNLDVLTPHWLHFRILTPGVAMRAGARFDYQLRFHGIPVKWQSEITVWEPPFCFVDRQTRGPYRLWVHEHTFESREGETLMRDSVQYAAPGGVLIRKFLVAPDLKKIWDFRRVRMESIFGRSAKAVI